MVHQVEAGRIAWELNHLSVTNLVHLHIPVINSILLGVWQKRPGERERNQEKIEEEFPWQMGCGKQKRGENHSRLDLCTTNTPYNRHLCAMACSFCAPRLTRYAQGEEGIAGSRSLCPFTVALLTGQLSTSNDFAYITNLWGRTERKRGDTKTKCM